MAPDFATTWKPAAEPPAGTPGHWSRAVVVIMNTGMLRQLAFFWSDRADEAGRWQRLRGTIKGEEPAWWIDPPPAA
jgi:hypothetical protein